MALSYKQLIEKLNQRLSGETALTDKEGGEEDIEPLESKDAFPVDYEPLLKSLKKEFGEEAFVRPAKENDEVICVYFDPETYAENGDKFSLVAIQEWCFEKGFAIVSKMSSEDSMKVYFTPIRMLNKIEDMDKGSKGEEFSKSNFGKSNNGEAK